MLAIIKLITYSASAGLIIGGVWNLQNLNYYFGTITGLALAAGWIVIAAKKGN